MRTKTEGPYSIGGSGQPGRTSLFPSPEADRHRKPSRKPSALLRPNEGPSTDIAMIQLGLTLTRAKQGAQSRSARACVGSGFLHKVYRPLPFRELSNKRIFVAEKYPPSGRSAKGGGQTDNVGLQFLTIPTRSELPSCQRHQVRRASPMSTTTSIIRVLPVLQDNKPGNAADPTSACKVMGCSATTAPPGPSTPRAIPDTELLTLPESPPKPVARSTAPVTEEIQALTCSVCIWPSSSEAGGYTSVYLLRDRPTKRATDFGLLQTRLPPRVKAALYLHT